MVTRKLKRPLYAISAGVLAAASLVPLLVSTTAHAYGLVTSRSIQLSSSQAAATSVTYKVKFTPATSATVGGVVVDFCDNSPIIGDSCTAPVNNFSVGTPTVSLVSGITGFSAAAANSNRTLILTNGTPQALSNATPVEFDLTTATNPDTTNHTYYARIITYDTNTHANAYSATAAGGGTGAIDAGGIALSTANQLTITSKVQERLTFCVYTGANCAAGGNTVTLGDTNGVLDPQGPYVDKNTKYDVATNASQGVAIRLKGDTLKTGSFDIAAIGATATTSALGTEQFGFCTYQSAGSGLTPVNLYDGDASGTTSTACTGTAQSAGTASTGGDNSAAFAFDTANTNTTYGQVFANKAAGSSSTGVIPFIGNIANTTEAGIYTTTLTFIATGIY